jgi:vacuolar-type H+-ATPase subunit F/Vma7
VFKFSKNVDEYEFFGIKQYPADLRNDFARVASDSAWVIIIHKKLYEQIVKKTQLSVSEQKIEFLLRYVPKLRALTRNMIEELEVLFIKEVATQGYLIQRQDEQDDYIYFVYKGRCKLLVSTNGEGGILPQEAQTN